MSETNEPPVRIDFYEKPPVEGYYWWLPKFALEAGFATNPSYWHVKQVEPDTPLLGRFWGPLARPIEQWEAAHVEPIPLDYFPSFDELRARFPAESLREDTLQKGRMYLRLWHGFESEEHRAAYDGWGADGPYIGPLKYAHTTYGTYIKCQFADDVVGIPMWKAVLGDLADGAWMDMQFSTFELVVSAEGVVCLNGVEFGDYSVFIA